MFLVIKKTLEGTWSSSWGEVSSVSRRGCFFIVFSSANSNQTQSHRAARATLITSPRLPASPIDCLFVRIFEREMFPSEKKLTCSLIQQREVCLVLIVYWLWRQRDYLEKITQGNVGRERRDGRSTTWKDRFDLFTVGSSSKTNLGFKVISSGIKRQTWGN